MTINVRKLQDNHFIISTNGNAAYFTRSLKYQLFIEEFLRKGKRLDKIFPGCGCTWDQTKQLELKRLNLKRPDIRNGPFCCVDNTFLERIVC